MFKLRQLAKEHFNCDCILIATSDNIKIIIKVYKDISVQDFRRARRDFYKLLRREGYHNVANYVSVERGINE